MQAGKRGVYRWHEARAGTGGVEPAPVYIPRDPGKGVLAPLVRQWWPRHVESVEAEGGTVPAFVHRAVERFLACGDANEGFITLKCSRCGAERALAFSCKVRGLCPSCGARRMHDVAHHLVERLLPAVAVRQYVLSPPSELVGLLAARGEALSSLSRIFVKAIFAGVRARSGSELACGAVVVFQRFNKALTVYPHLHVLVLDGGYVTRDEGTLEFVEDETPGPSALRELEDRVEERFMRWLKRHGFLEDEPLKPKADDDWWTAAAREPSGLLAPVTPRRKRGFEVHASVRVAGEDKAGRERLCRYVMRPPLAEEQLELIEEERVRLTFRSPTRSGQRSIDLHPLALMRRLAWLVPPRQHQIRYTGVLAPAAELRPAVVPAGRVGVQRVWFGDRSFVPAEPVPYRERWARLLARVFDVDAQQCPECHGRLSPVGAVLPPRAAARLEHGRILVLRPTGPPAQLALPLATA